MLESSRNENRVENNEIINSGAITLFFKDTQAGRKYLVIRNSETGSVTFVSGKNEETDESLFDTAQREIKEEIGILPSEYKLFELPDVKHEFVFGPQKKERSGQKGEYQVFAANLTDTEKAIIPTEEVESVKWLTEEKILEQLSFHDLKEVFVNAVNKLQQS